MLEEIEKELQIGQVGPIRASELRATLSGQYSFISGQLEAVLTKKPRIWMEIREGCKSDKSADRQWDATKMGITEMSCRLRLKRIDKVISALSSLIRVAEGAAKNQF